ncbi:MAG TPA: N-acetyltransferase [Gaiellaceae bacterium]
MVVRRYAVADRSAVRQIHAEAFRQQDDPDALPLEVGLFDQLIDAGDAIDALSFVALREDEPVGHVMCSRATIGSHTVPAIGPIGVLPKHQNHGAGIAMMHAVLGAADALDHPVVVLLGSTAYYSRFGFRPAMQLGIEPPDPAWGDHFQARPLTAYDASITGPFRYAAPFDDL